MHISQVTRYYAGSRPRLTHVHGALLARRRGLHGTTDLWIPVHGDGTVEEVEGLLVGAFSLRAQTLQDVSANLLELRERLRVGVVEGSPVPDTSPRPRCLALARLVAVGGVDRGLSLHASAAAVAALAEGSLRASTLAEAATRGAPPSGLEGLAARSISRLVAHAFVPREATEVILRSTAAVLGHLGVGPGHASERVERAWRLDAS